MIRQRALWLAAAILCAASPGDSVVVAQAAARLSLPNPYQPAAPWGTLPPGRTWGAPAAVDIDIDGRSVWVLERCGANSCAESTLDPVLKFDPSGRLIASFGAGLLAFPHGLHIDRAGNVWVVDGKAENGKGHQVFKFSPQGRVLLTLGTAGVAGETNDTFNMPSDVAVAANGDIFVADGHNPLRTNMRIVKFSKDGKFLKTWGHKGSAPGEIDDPHGIAFDSAGRLFVADRRNNRLQIFSQDGQFLAEWKQFGRPSGLYIAADDTLYVADQDAGVTIGSAKDGSIRGFIAPPPGVTRVAESVAVDAAGNIYAGENATMRLVRYVKR